MACLKRKSTAAFALSMLLSLTAFSEETTTEVKLSSLAPAVQESIQKQLGKNTLQKIEKSVGDLETTFDVEIKSRGRSREITLDEDGKLLEKEVFLGETPLKVRSAIKAQLGSNNLSSITKVFDEETISYEVEFENGGNSRTFTMDENGKLLELEISLTDAPPAVQESISRALNTGTLGMLSKVFDEDGIYYEAEVKRSEKGLAVFQTISIDEKGVVTETQEKISVMKTPDAVQKTIHDLAIDGRVTSLLKVKDSDGVTFEVEIKHQTGRQSFTIGTDGKIVPD